MTTKDPIQLKDATEIEPKDLHSQRRIKDVPSKPKTPKDVLLKLKTLKDVLPKPKEPKTQLPFS
jgi:hypothetical protein